MNNLSVYQLDTPSLIVDLDLMESNSRKMMNFINASGHFLRPHVKAHKIPELAMFQLNEGAEGICTAKLGEMEVMVKAGIKNVLNTTPIANEQKNNRLSALLKSYPEAKIIQVIDSIEHVRMLENTLSKDNLKLEVLVEVETGQERCGVLVGKELLDLVAAIKQSKSLIYTGIQAYSGHLQHIVGYQDRVQQARAAVLPLINFLDDPDNKRQLECKILSGGGTGTYDSYFDMPFTEIQAGSYLFMDYHYRTIGAKNGEKKYNDFKCALKVLTTVISKPTPNRAVVDAGMKALTIDSGEPVVEEFPELLYTSGGDEHGIIDTSKGIGELRIGDKLLMIPSHCDTTLNQFNTLYGIRNGIIETEWEIKGRGRSD